jgi:hypothetical protein
MEVDLRNSRERATATTPLEISSTTVIEITCNFELTLFECKKLWAL